MAEQDANTDVENVEPDSSSDVELETIEDDDGFVSTTEFREVEEAPEPETDDGGDTPQKQDKPDPEKQDFSQHPRFQELIAEKNELKERLAKVEAGNKPKEDKPQSKYKYQNIMGMQDEEIVDKFTNNPKEFLSNYAQQMAHEIMRDLQTEGQQRQQQQQQQDMQQREMKTYEDFFKDKPDGIEMLQSRQIHKFMNENPGHNPISAYHALAGETHYQTKLDEAVKKEREKILNELKAAGKAGPVKGNTASKSYADPDPKPARNKAELKQAMLQRFKRR